MFEISRTEDFEGPFKWFQKKRPKELQAVLNNLDKFVNSLRGGGKPKPFAFGFLHAERSDVIAIDQSGGGRNLSETRLYVYVDAEGQTIYLLTFGDKSTQHKDIQDCRRVRVHGLESRVFKGFQRPRHPQDG